MIEAQTPEKIHHDISSMLANGVSYIDGFVEYSKIKNIEIETVAEIVKKSTIIKEKIRVEATKMRLVKPNVNAPRQLCD